MGDIWNKMNEEMSKEAVAKALDMGMSEGISTSFQNSQSAMSKKKKKNEYYSPDLGKPLRTAKMADKAPKINLRKSYPE